MEKQIEDKISCTNCKYFVQHYRKQITSYAKIFCGHCKNENTKLTRKKRLPIMDGCENWEREEEKQVGDILTAIYEQLQFLSKRAEEMQSILGELIGNE